MNDLRIVVAGHVDHGKSTLIGRLLYDTGALPQQMAARFGPADEAQNTAALAFITDQLAEEQKGSFTLDTAQAHFRMAGREYSLIDTPGHREFLKNMITGTTRADAAILVVDADEGLLAQTYLHAYLIAMLGIRKVIVVINKMDLISYDGQGFRDLSQKLHDHLKRIGIAPRAVIPVSAQQGDGVVRPSARMPWNVAPTLAGALDELTPRRPNEQAPLRFAVQCPFPAKDRYAVLGRIVSGRLHQGQTIVFGPGDHQTSIVSVLLGQQEACAATVGQSVTLLLEDPTPVHRGHIGCDVGSRPWVTGRFSAQVFWIGAHPLEVHDRVEVLCGTQSHWSHVERIVRVIDPISLETLRTEAACIEDSEIAEIVLRTDTPMCIDPFDTVPELGRCALLQNGRIAGGAVIIARKGNRPKPSSRQPE